MNFYNDHAASYAAQTLGLDMTPLYQKFLSYLSPGAKILDAGCGPGRDLRFFKTNAYQVEGFDSSIEMVKLALKENLPVRHLSFEQIDWIECFDAVWASASLLHLPKASFSSAVSKLTAALKTGGILYFSLKVGRGESVAEDGRFFAYYTEDEIRSSLSSMSGLEMCDLWITEDRASRSKTQWLNVIASKK